MYFKSARMRELDHQLGDPHCDIIDREAEMMHKLQQRVLSMTTTLLDSIDAVAELDCLLSLASCAMEGNFVRPKLVPEPLLDIVAGRHPLQASSVSFLCFPFFCF